MFAIPRVHRGDDRPDAHRREEGDRELDPVRHPEADDVALAHTPCKKRAGGTVDLFVKIAKREPRTAEAERNTAGPASSGFRRQVSKPGSCGHRSSSLKRFVVVLFAGALYRKIGLRRDDDRRYDTEPELCAIEA